MDTFHKPPPSLSSPSNTLSQNHPISSQTQSLLTPTTTNHLLQQTAVTPVLEEEDDEQTVTLYPQSTGQPLFADTVGSLNAVPQLVQLGNMHQQQQQHQYQESLMAAFYLQQSMSNQMPTPSHIGGGNQSLNLQFSPQRYNQLSMAQSLGTPNHGAVVVRNQLSNNSIDQNLPPFYLEEVDQSQMILNLSSHQQMPASKRYIQDTGAEMDSITQQNSPRAYSSPSKPSAMGLDPQNPESPRPNEPKNSALFKSPKVSSLYRSVQQQKLIDTKLPHQINRTQKLFNQTLNVLQQHDFSAEYPIKRRISQKRKDEEREKVETNDGLSV